MITFKLKFTFSLLLFCRLSFRSEASATYADHICTNTFRSNLNLLLSVLSSNSTIETGFYNATAGQSTNATVYGLFLCRGDLSPEACQDCVATATREVVGTYCPREKTVVIWYDECMIRYSDQSLFSIVDRTYQSILNNSPIEKDPQGIMRVLEEVMPELATRAAGGSGSVGKKFAVVQRNYSVVQTLYATAQCTPDISIAGCTTCLQDAISSLPNCCQGSSGVRILLPSCNIRYENFLFQIAVKKMMKKKKYLPVREDNTWSSGSNITRESWQFDFATIQAATDNFSDINKLGEGGFGFVYKGILSNGKTIAVKRLSKNSVQGVEEFKNEAILVAKLHHRNLVRMLGYCLEGKEKILIYEFVSNGSLDYFLFDPKLKGELDWSRRYKIIKGIARGLLYLHEDSQLRIIHRDLKASNILLDKDMNAKISDFGTARIIWCQSNSRKHYGYMSPEYVLRGHFSVKSDVFSFGVLMLEMISGNKNSNFYNSNMNSLLNYARRLWRNGTPLDIVDPTLGQSYPSNEVLRCIDLALSCVQDDLDARPSMATAVLMLNHHSFSSMRSPQQPATFFQRTMVSGIVENTQSDKSNTQISVNDLSLSEVYPR